MTSNTGLEHPDWEVLRERLREPSNLELMINRRAPKAFLVATAATVLAWAGVLLAYPLTAAHVVAMSIVLGAALGLLTAAWPHRHHEVPFSQAHQTLRVAAGWMVWILALHQIRKGVGHRHHHDGQSNM